MLAIHQRIFFFFVIIREKERDIPANDILGSALGNDQSEMSNSTTNRSMLALNFHGMFDVVDYRSASKWEHMHVISDVDRF